MYNANVAQCCTKWKKIQRRVYCVDITWMYKVRGMVNDLDIVWHEYSTTYDCSLYHRLTFWWSIDLTYKYHWHALFTVNCHLDLTTDNEKVVLSGMLVCSYAMFSTGVCRIHSELQGTWILIMYILLCYKLQTPRCTVGSVPGRSGPARSSRYDWDRWVVRASRAPIGLMRDIYPSCWSILAGKVFLVSSFSMLQANSVSKFLLWANSCPEQIWFLWAVFLYCEQIFFNLSNSCEDRNCVMRPYEDWK